MKKNYTMGSQPRMLAYAACILLLSQSFLGCQKTIPIPQADLDKIQHVVVIYMENHSFDNLYGDFPGAVGLSDAPKDRIIQVDSTGKPYLYLPAITGTTAFPTNLANTYFDIDQYVPNDEETPDVLHRYYQEQLQI